ncbi:unnamed protein product [Prunus armeniaca]
MCTKYRYTKIFKGNEEQGSWPTTCAFKSSKWQGKLLSDNSVLSTSTPKYLKATGNGKTSQPPVQSNRAGTRKYLKLTVNGETGQPHVQSYQAGGWGNLCHTLVY